MVFWWIELDSSSELLTKTRREMSSDYIDEMVEYRWCELVWNVCEVAPATCSELFDVIVVWEFV